MKATKKRVRRKIVVALLGMCMAVSSYTVPESNASPIEAQATPAVQSASGEAQSQIAAFWDPFWPVYYGYYYYYYPYYYAYYPPYYYPYFYFYYY
jgi:hypothetical protein